MLGKYAQHWYCWRLVSCDLLWTACRPSKTTISRNTLIKKHIVDPIIRPCWGGSSKYIWFVAFMFFFDTTHMISNLEHCLLNYWLWELNTILEMLLSLSYAKKCWVFAMFDPSMLAIWGHDIFHNVIILYWFTARKIMFCSCTAWWVFAVVLKTSVCFSHLKTVTIRFRSNGGYGKISLRESYCNSLHLQHFHLVLPVLHSRCLARCRPHQSK